MQYQSFKIFVPFENFGQAGEMKKWILFSRWRSKRPHADIVYSEIDRSDFLCFLTSERSSVWGEIVAYAAAAPTDRVRTTDIAACALANMCMHTTADVSHPRCLSHCMSMEHSIGS